MSEARSDPSSGAEAAESAVHVRAIVPADIPRVWELLNGLAEHERLTDWVSGDAEKLADALFGPGDRLHGLVAEHANRIIGYALYYPVFGSFRSRWRLWLEDLYVEPDSRDCGAGMAMMAALARLVAEGDYAALDWEVLDWNRVALDFYTRLGAEPNGAERLRYRLDAAALESLLERNHDTAPNG